MSCCHTLKNYIYIFVMLIPNWKAIEVKVKVEIVQKQNLRMKSFIEAILDRNRGRSHKSKKKSSPKYLISYTFPHV